jgi:hypothetical protein
VYYFYLVMLPGFYLSLASFGTLWMSFEVGERLGYGITLLLAVQVMQQVVTAAIPIAGVRSSAPRIRTRSAANTAQRSRDNFREQHTKQQLFITLFL